MELVKHGWKINQRNGPLPKWGRDLKTKKGKTVKETLSLYYDGANLPYVLVTGLKEAEYTERSECNSAEHAENVALLAKLNAFLEVREEFLKLGRAAADQMKGFPGLNSDTEDVMKWMALMVQHGKPFEALLKKLEV